MPVQRSESVTQAKMDALAALANAKIPAGWKSNPDPYFFPPLLDAPAPGNVAGSIEYNGDIWSYTAVGQTVTIEVFAYTNVAGGRSYSSVAGRAAVVLDNSGTNATVHWSWDAVPGADGYMLKIGQLDNSSRPPAYFVLSTNTTFADVTYSFFDQDIAYQFDGVENAAVGLQIDPRSWLYQVNRIRQDFWYGFFNDHLLDIFLTEAALLSGPWIVATNDPIAYPLTQTSPVGPVVEDTISWQGELLGNLTAAGLANGYFTCYRSVRFYFAAADAPEGFSAATGRRVDDSTITGNEGAQDLVLDYDAALSGHWSGTVKWPFEYTGAGPAPAPPMAAGFGATATPGAGITWRTYADSVDGHYWIEADIDLDIAAGAGSIHFTLAPPADFEMTQSVGGCRAISSSYLIFSSQAVLVAAAVVHPASAGAYIAADDIPANSDFTINGQYAKQVWKISDATVNGCWSAMTLPAPAMNVFLDPDMVPYVAKQRLPAPGDIAVAADILSGTMDNPNLPFQTSMREAESVVAIDSDNFRSTNSKWGIMSPGVSPRPAPWLVLRDTDTQPYSWGFEVNKHFTLFNDRLQGRDRTDPPVDFFVFPGAVQLKIRVYNYGAQIQAWDKTPLNDKQLLVKVWNGGNPDIDPPYITGINEITLPPDAALDPLSTIWAVTVENPNAGDEEFTTYQLFIEIDDAGALPYPIYFPRLKECFSLCLTGARFEGNELDAASLSHKAIPQNGYCIFKIRASQLPVTAADLERPAPGAEDVDVDVGIMREGDFVALQTITIPAGASTTGDIEVFWPVIAGEEIRWRSDQDVAVEAWGNFQPIFYSKFYSGLPLQGDGLDPFGYSEVLNFANFFDPQNANYLAMARQTTKAQFPIFKELYNDLEAVLGLI